MVDQTPQIQAGTAGPLGVVVQNIYLFGGRTNQRFTVDRRSAFDPSAWIAGPDLEIFDGSGTLYYLETITTNVPPKEFYRTTLMP